MVGESVTVMSIITDTFERLRTENRRAFIPFFCAGDPDLGTTRRLMACAGRSGADIVEVGFPFSDPIADGPTIQAAYYRALKNGFKVRQAFELMEECRASGSCAIPSVAMVSITLIESMGSSEFVRRTKESGFNGLIVPDCPVDRWGGLEDDVKSAGLDMIALVAPNSPPARRKLASEKSSGFIYQMSITGITGARAELPGDLAECITAIKRLTRTPVAVGFGISTPEHVRTVCNVADGAIVGSALVKLAAETLKGGDAAGLEKTISDFIGKMAAAAHGVR
jgi:tryptophan synthase alpha chain